MKNVSKMLVGVVAVVGISVFAYGLRQGVHKTDTTKIHVAASFYPLAHFATQVGGNFINVTTITPPGSEPHDYEPTPTDIITLNSSRLVLLNGSGLDAWGQKMRPELEKNGIGVVNMSDSLPLLVGPTGEEGSLDPHFWLDPVLAQKEVDLIRYALTREDPAHATEYGENAGLYTKELAALDQQYIKGLEHCALHEIITSHAAFGYLAKRYNLTVHTIAGLSPDEEPSAERLAELTKLVKAQQIHYIFFETLVSPKLAETVAKETGARTIVFNPLEGLTNAEIAAGKTYISVMRDNLQSLRTALECK